MKTKAKDRRGAHDTETDRVVGLPEEDFTDVDLTQKLRTRNGTMTLRPIQSEALAAIEANNGGFFPIGVGHGKSLIGLLAGTMLDCDLAIMLTPASTVATLRKTYAETRRHFRMTKIRVRSYEMFSSPQGASLLAELIDGYDPNRVVVVCDEAHRLKARTSVRTKRLIRYFQEHPAIRFVAMSGTMTAKGLEDFKHLAELCLRESSPVPRDRRHFSIWQSCIDVDGRPNQTAWQVIEPLWVKFGPDSPFKVRGKERRARIREAFQNRLRSAPGVVASKAGSLGCSLYITGRSFQLSPKITHLLDRLESDGELPDGDIAADDIAKWRAHRQLSQGFFLRWDWPENKPDHAWLDARRRWNQCLRRELEVRDEEGYDSGFLVASRIERELTSGKLPRLREIHKAWLRWSSEKDKPAPPTVAVWIDDSFIQDAVRWLDAQTEPSILWYEHQTVGDALERFGVKVYRAGDEPDNDGRPCAMSIAAHGIGKNLQSWCNQLIMCPPSSGHVWEQLLGRTHRPGQEADEVRVVVYAHTPRFVQALQQALVDADYIQTSTGNTQKILFADTNI